MSQSDDMDSINRYMLAQKPATSKATSLKDDWIKWYESMSWWDRTQTSENYDLDRNKRDEYNLANATSSQQKKDVEAVIKGGLATEQTQAPAGTDLDQYNRRTSKGTYVVESPPLIPDKYKVGALVVGSLAVVAFAYNAPHAIAGAFTGRRPLSEKLARIRRRVGRRISGHS